MAGDNTWNISSDKNDGYPYLPFLPEPKKIKYEPPYPEKMFRISDDINNGYPYLPFLPEPTKFSFAPPYPEKMFRISADVNDGYPYLLFLEKIVQNPCSSIYFKNSKVTELWWRGERVDSVFFRRQKIME